MINEENNWEIRFHQYEYPFYYYHFYNFGIGNDTLIDNRNYKLLIDFNAEESSPEGIIGFCYEDSSKFFFRPFNDTIDFLLYDYNLEIGDSFYLPNVLFDVEFDSNANIIVLNNIDSIQAFDGNFRKRLNFDFIDATYQDLVYLGCNNFNNFSWIDGIGNQIHPIYPIWGCFESGAQVDCFFNDNLELFGGCLYSPVDEIEKQSLNIYPNPAKRIINIESSNMLIDKVELFTLDGKKIDISLSNRNQIDLSNYPNGIYILGIRNNDSRYIVQKIIKTSE